MNTLHAPTPRRHCLSVILRSVAMPVAAAMALTAIGSLSAEAGQIRTAFKFAAPSARVGMTIRNGERIALEVTLHDGTRGIPNQEIKFYVTINKKPVLVGKAKTDRNGRASVNPRIVIPGLVGRNWTPVPWVPEFSGNGQFAPAQNTNLGGGFRVLP